MYAMQARSVLVHPGSWRVPLGMAGEPIAVLGRSIDLPLGLDSPEKLYQAVRWVPLWHDGLARKGEEAGSNHRHTSEEIRCAGRGQTSGTGAPSDL